MLVQDPSGFLFGAGMDPPALVSSEDPQRRVCDRGIDSQGLPRRNQGVPAEERMIPGRTREQVPLRGPQRIEVVAEVPTDFVEIQRVAHPPVDSPVRPCDRGVLDGRRRFLHTRAFPVFLSKRWTLRAGKEIQISVPMSAGQSVTTTALNSVSPTSTSRMCWWPSSPV